MQVTGKADFIAQYLENGDLYGMIVSIIKTMPGAPVIMVVVLMKKGLLPQKKILYLMDITGLMRQKHRKVI